jgi:cytochrome c biogenesis protein CcmG/thiol:disulfide interchange protein DsbE
VRGYALTLASLAVVAGCVGCGASEPKSAAPSKAQAAKALAGAPPALASLHKQGNQLLFGGKSAFDSRIASLRGHPVVVNKWASWCAPCRGEFPVFQKVSVQLGKKVGFLGVDGNDPNDGARGFLKRYPVSYPSYSDPDERIASSIKASGPYPATVFFDPRGKVVFTHYGPYSSASDLITDIHRYGA